MPKPTVEDIREERVETVHEEITGEWRWGNFYFLVVKDDEGKLWGLEYRRSIDGESNSLRDDPESHEIQEVEEIEVVVKSYVFK